MQAFHPFRLDVDNQCLWRADTRVPLMPKPFAVLRYLVEHAGRLVTHDELLTAIWPDTYVQPEVLRRYILEIRRALGDRAESPRFIETLPKRGYQFVATVTGEPPGDLPAPAASSSGLVGREGVLAQLHDHLRNAVQGRRQLVFIVGEPGIGKTSLVDAFQRASAGTAGVVVARGQSVEGFGGKEAYYPILEAIGRLARGSSKTLVINTLATHAPTWLIQFPALVRAEQLAALERGTLASTRERMVRELCEAVEIITQTITLIVALEDLHWVDHSTLDLISAMARRREPARLLVLGTFRPADLILSESPLKTLRQDLLLHGLCHELCLERLSEADVADYLAAELGASDLPAGLAGVIHRHSDGNPLFMTAMVDHLARRGVLTRTDGRWQMTVPLADLDPGVPETLRQMLELQLQHASATEQRLLACASVAGQQFTPWSIATMLNGNASEIDDTCRVLAERQQFLKASGIRELPNGVSSPHYAFRHALYREILYRRLMPSERVSFHRRLAEALEASGTPLEPEMAAEIALHYGEGREYERAVRFSIVAAANATRRYAHREALAVLEHARALLRSAGPGGTEDLELQILERMGNAYYALGDMMRSADAYETMAVRAAAAGLLAEKANALVSLVHPAESIPFFLRAVEIDPGFVPAYTSLSRIYSNMGDTERAKVYATLAYDRREQVGPRELLSITYQYHYEATGDQGRATETLEAWKKSFPQEFQPANSLTLIHNFLGRFERAVDEGLEAVRRNPSHGYPYSNLAHAYRGLGRLDDARRTAEQAVALNIETLPTRRLLYQLAVLAGDTDAAARHVNWSRDQPREFDVIGARAQAAGYAGKLHEARSLYDEAVRMAEQRNLTEVASGYLAQATWMELAYGNTERACSEARRVLARKPGYDPRLRAALILGAAGEADQAQPIVGQLTRANPEHTFINAILAPAVNSAVALGRMRPEHAIAQLEPATPYETGFVAALAPMYLRARSLLMMRCAARAASEFQRILDHRGSDPFSPFCAIAWLGLARARSLSDDTAGSLHAYERFLAEWSDADPDIPLLLEAREEYGVALAAK